MIVIRKKLDNFFKILFWGFIRRIDIFGVYWVFRYCRCCIFENMINFLVLDYFLFVCLFIFYNICMYSFLLIFIWFYFDCYVRRWKIYIFIFFFICLCMLYNYNVLLIGFLLNWFKCLWLECFLCVTIKYGVGKFYVF